MTSCSRTLFTAVASSIVAMSLTFTGCDMSASKNSTNLATSPADANKIDISKSGGNSQTTIKTDDGTTQVNTGTNLALPKNFPSDLHLPSTAYTISNVVKMDPPDTIKKDPTFVLTLHASAPISSLSAEYATAMKSAGWSETMTTQSAQSQSLMTFQKFNRVVTVTLVAVQGQDGGTNVSVQQIVK
jgi:hypothetical protein